MKKLLGFLAFACVCAVLSVGSTGCTKAKKADEPVKPAKAKDVTMAAAKDKVTVKAGESTEIKLTLARGADAKHEVKFDPTVDPKESGVTATVDTIAEAKTDGMLKIAVKDDAKPGDYKVTVAGKSTDSAALSATVTVTVPKKDIAVLPPKKDKLEASDGKDITIKQGDKKDVKITYTVGADAKIKTIAAKSDNDKVTAKINPDTFDKSGEATVTITVAADAKEGVANVMVTATGDGSTPAMVTTTIKITVEKAK